MKLPNYRLGDPVLPTESDAKSAAIASQVLASYLQERKNQHRFQLIEDETNGMAIELPAIALELLLEMLVHLAGSKAVKLNPIGSEVTISEAANILGVERSYLVEKINSGEIPLNTEKSKYGLFYRDVIEYKKHRERQRINSLKELAIEAHKLNL